MLTVIGILLIVAQLGFIIIATAFNFRLLTYYRLHGTRKQWMDRVIHCIVYASLSLVLVLIITKAFFNKGQLPELFQRAIKTRREQI